MKLAIFDIDGTLTNTNGVDDECFVKALAEAHAITEIDTDWATYPHTTDSGITLHIFQEKFGRHPEETELGKFKGCFVNMLGVQYESRAIIPLTQKMCAPGYEPVSATPLQGDERSGTNFIDIALAEEYVSCALSESALANSHLDVLIKSLFKIGPAFLRQRLSHPGISNIGI